MKVHVTKLRITIIIACMLFITTRISCQIKGTFGAKINDESYCCLYLQQSGKYHIDLIFSNNSYTISISDGYYKLEKDTISLIDSFNHNTFKIEVKNDYILNVNYLTIKHGYIWMKNLKLVLDQESTYIPLETTINTIEKERKKNNKENKKIYPIHFGLYKACQWEWCFVLDLQKPNKYIYSIEGMVLSKGTFERKKNELILFDDSLNHKFFFFIKNNLIEEWFIPSNAVLEFSYCLK